MPAAPETCPNCGADVPRGAKACPACGSDESTGWSDVARYGGLDLPDDQFNYDDYVKREFASAGKPSPPRGVSWFWWGVAVALLIGVLAMFVF